MARLFNGSTDWLNKGGAVLTAIPMTFSCWFTIEGSPSYSVPIGLGDNTSNGTPAIQIIYESSDDFIHAEYAMSSADDDSAAANTVVTHFTWHHAAAVFAGPASRSCYLDGGSKVTSTVNVTAAGTLNETRLGNMALNLTGFSLLGQLAFTEIWSAALTDPEILALSQGISPKLIRPASLFSYVRMSGGNSPEPDFCLGRGGWSVVGSPTFSTNPRIFGP